MVAAAIASFGTMMVVAQDAKQDVAKQKEAAAANLKKAELGKTVVVETDSFLIATTLTEDKGKALGAVLEKVVPIARKSRLPARGSSTSRRKRRGRANWQCTICPRDGISRASCETWW
jgi:hypothetical protein